jgi:hypothetical protein
MARQVGKEDRETGGELFHVEKGVLRVNGDMYWEYLEEFDAACRKVLETRRSRIEVDLTAVNFISSSFLGCLGGLVLRASRLKKRITLKVTLDISWLFDIMGVQKNMDVEVV